MSWTVTYYETAAGRNPVHDHLRSLPVKERQSVVEAILLLEGRGIDLGLPHVRPLRNKLWELRCHGPNLQHRVLYVAQAGQDLLLLHAFTKKTQQTPDSELATAEQRLAEWQARRNQPKPSKQERKR